jgi:hypothetical protein
VRSWQPTLIHPPTRYMRRVMGQFSEAMTSKTK